ncbi:DUF1223 domain-containing protein [Hydrocarboniphaga sp.]|uniref:DUF1223 domain-containing protein n=1 Tax=Hydrocarboniphaga sp. TaxID=2033016 RepID=UPI003D141495
MNRLLALAALAFVGNAAAAPRTPVILELFTSQSCSSCPPAEALAGRLNAEQPIAGVEVLVLAQHVDYWNDIGWKDPYSSASLTDRQRRYAQTLGQPSRVYTPQAIIDGRLDAIGSDESAVIAGLKEAATHPHQMLQFSVARSADQLSLTLAPIDSRNEALRYQVAIVQDGIVTPVGSGENGGRTLREDGVVRSLQTVDPKSPPKLSLPKASGGSTFRVIAFAQQKRDGRIVASAQQRVPAS